MKENNKFEKKRLNRLYCGFLFIILIIFLTYYWFLSFPSNEIIIFSPKLNFRSTKVPIPKTETKQISSKLGQLSDKISSNKLLSEESDKPIESKLSSHCLQTIPEIDHGPHIVSPPNGKVTLVCCTTTVGILNIAIHPSWAPIGSLNFLNMVKFGFFSSKVCLFRALKDFLIQFGLAGNEKIQKEYERYIFNQTNRRTLIDDKNWLPEGPTGRMIHNISRYQLGYISYAGSGVNSRGTQLFITNHESLYLGGGSPWEVPIGQLVGKESFETILKVNTEYGEAPSQMNIRQEGNIYLQREFPHLDYILSCDIIAEDLPWKYQPLNE